MSSIRRSCAWLAGSAMSFAIQMGDAEAQTSFVYAGNAVAIPDAADLTGNNPGAQVGAPIDVAGLVGIVAEVTLSIDGTVCNTTAGSNTVGLDHTFVNDLNITLRSPAGTEVLVINQTDGGGNNLCQVVLDDASAGASIQTALTAQAPFTGSWTPNASLSAFDGEAPNGQWTLLAQDFFNVDTGSIRAWTVTITTGNVAPIPTLAEWSRLGLFALLALMGWAAIRRQTA